MEIMLKDAYVVSLHVQMTEDFRRRILALADEMAASASEKSAHSYDNLIRARAELKGELETVI